MAAAGVECHINLMKHATMGFAEVVRRIGTYAKLLRQTEAILAREKPDAVVLIDNPGFNLRVAAAAKRRGMKVVYYVSPQVWAWYSSRIRRIARLVDKMLVILPFEAELYRRHGVDCEFVGHPLLDYLSETRLDEKKLEELAGQGRGRVVGLLPGSRQREVTKVFPLIARAAAELKTRVPDVTFSVACAHESHVASVGRIMRAAGVEGNVYHDRTFEIMKASRVCIAVSGTATLELCYFGTPMVVVYRAPAAAKPLASLMLKTRHISLVNVLAGREVAPEFFMFGDAHRPIAMAAGRLLTNESRWEECRAELRRVIEKLGSPGASDRAAAAVLAVAEGD